MARPQDGGGPEEILERDRGGIVSRLRAAAGTKPGGTVEPQVWGENRSFPRGYIINEGTPLTRRDQPWRRPGIGGPEAPSGPTARDSTTEQWEQRVPRGLARVGQAGASTWATIRRSSAPGLCHIPGAQGFRGKTADIIEVATRPIESNNGVRVLWVPAHAGIKGNEVADGMAKEAAGSRGHDVPDEIRWHTSLPHLSRRATECRAIATSQRVRDHVRPERRCHPPGGSGLRRRILRRIWGSTAQRYYQLLSGHAAIGFFLHDRMTGPQRLESDRCWWCNCGKRQTRHHLFTECWAQIRRLWMRIGKDCKREHPRAPSVRWLWKEDATEAVIEFLEDTPVGPRSSGMVRVSVDGRESVGQLSEGEEGGPSPP